MDITCFRGKDPRFAEGLLARFSPVQMISWMEELGVRTMDRDGYCYPATGQASSVLDCLLLACKRQGVQIVTGQTVNYISPDFGHFLIATDEQKYFAKNVILACGTPAGLKESDNRESLVRSLELPFVPFLPALGKLTAKAPFLSTWKGVRFDGKVSILAEGKKIAESEGEIQLTEDGISGIPVFQVSRFAAAAMSEKKQVTARLNFLPDYQKEDLLETLKTRAKLFAGCEFADSLTGLVHKKLILLFLRQAGLRDRVLADQVTDEQMNKLADALLSLKLSITGTCPLSGAQAAAGGIETSSVDPVTMESKWYPGLHITGEILDIDGTCGGYNLHFAWMTAMAAVHGMEKV